jgi:hypothetical protein
MIKNSISILFVSLLLLSGGCQKACDDYFAMVTVAIEDAEGNPVTLDDAYTIRLSNGDTIRGSEMYAVNIYEVVNDNLQSALKGKKEDFRFVGILDNAIVIDEIYRITADKCHISKLSGPEKIVLP